jgi:hypothetical protein
MHLDPNAGTVEAALPEKLTRHVELLRSMESSFGHATALSKYGQKFLAPRARPDWLLPGPKGACFGNSMPYAITRKDVFYAEGYAMEPKVPIPIQHAWLVDRTGAVIDATWDDNKEHVYFGIAFKHSLVSEVLANNGNEPGILVNIHLLRQHFRTAETLEDAITRGQASLESNDRDRSWRVE